MQLVINPDDQCYYLQVTIDGCKKEEKLPFMPAGSAGSQPVDFKPAITECLAELGIGPDTFGELLPVLDADGNAVGFTFAPGVGDPVSVDFPAGGGPDTFGSVLPIVDAEGVVVGFSWSPADGSDAVDYIFPATKFTTVVEDGSEIPAATNPSGATQICPCPVDQDGNPYPVDANGAPVIPSLPGSSQAVAVDSGTLPNGQPYSAGDLILTLGDGSEICIPTKAPTTLIGVDDGVFTVSIGDTINIDPTENDENPEGTQPIEIITVDGQDITAGPVTTADGVVVSLEPDGTLTVDSGTAEPGSYEISYGITDPEGDLSEGSISISLEGPPPSNFYIEGDETEADAADQLTEALTSGTPFEIAGNLFPADSTKADIDAFGQTQDPSWTCNPASNLPVYDDPSVVQNIEICIYQECQTSGILGEATLPNSSNGIWVIPVETPIGEKEFANICFETLEMCEIDQSQSDWMDNPQTIVTHAGGEKLLEGKLVAGQSLNTLTGSMAGFFIPNADNLDGGSIQFNKLAWAKANGHYINEDPVSITSEESTWDNTQFVSDWPTSASRAAEIEQGVLVDIVMKVCDSEIVIAARNDWVSDDNFCDSVFNDITPDSTVIFDPVQTVTVHSRGGIKELNDANDSIVAVNSANQWYQPHGTVQIYVAHSCGVSSEEFTGTVNSGSWTPATEIFFPANIANVISATVGLPSVGQSVVGSGTQCVDLNGSAGRTSDSREIIQSEAMFRNETTGDYVLFEGRQILGY